MSIEPPAVSHKQQEYILRAKLEWEQTFDAVSELIFIVDTEYNIIRCNRAMAEQCGLKITELVGHKCCELVHVRNCNTDNCSLTRMLNSGKVETFEFTLKNCNEIFEGTISPIVNTAGQLISNVFVARDITQKRKIDLALQESEQLFAIFMQHLPLAVSMKDESGKFLFANEYLTDLLNVDNIVGMTAKDLMPQEVAMKMEDDDAEALAVGLGLYKDIFYNGYGMEQVFDTYKFPIPLPNGITRLGTISLDVTEKRRQEVMLSEQKKQLEKLNSTLNHKINEAVAELRKKDAYLIQESRLTAMGEMISSIAHQWRQPLNNIGLIVQGLQLAFKANDLSVAELDEDIADTMKVLQQISATIDDFRNFFSTEHDLSTFIVNDIVSRALSFAEPALRSRGIMVKLQEKQSVTASGYPNEYTQAFLNIILNSRDALLDHQIKNPTVIITISEENGKSLVTVRDNGGGISEDVLPKIFDPYFTTKQQGKGAGIGLYMAKVIIESHMRGRLTACSCDDWAEFRIEVPS